MKRIAASILSIASFLSCLPRALHAQAEQNDVIALGIVAAAHGDRYKRGQGQGYVGDATSETPECTFLKLESKAEPKFMHDSSTNNLISRYLKYRQAA